MERTQPASTLESVKERLQELLTERIEGVLMANLPALLPQAWRQHDTVLKQFLGRFPSVVTIHGTPPRVWAVLARPLLLQAVRADVIALLASGSHRLDDLVAAYAARKRSANLEFIAEELAMCDNLPALLEEIGFIVVAAPNTGILTVRTATSPAPTPVPTTIPVPTTRPSPPAATAVVASHNDAALATVITVQDVQHCRDVVRKLKDDHPLALDCEGDLWTVEKGGLCLLQIASRSGACFIFDILRGGDQFFAEGGLRLLLEDIHVLKVGHDLRADSRALLTQHGVFLNNVFDTQVGHALLTDGIENSAGLNAVLEHYADGARNELKETVKLAWTRDPLYWSRRPLSEEMLRYAANDVRHLLRAFDRMAHALEIRAMLDRALSESRLYIDSLRFTGRPQPTAALAGSAPPHVEVVETEQREIVQECRIRQDDEDLGVILDALPERFRDALLASSADCLRGLVEVVLDLGRTPSVRFSGPDLPRVAQLLEDVVTEDDLHVFAQSVTRFDSENRAGIASTLHRISRLRSRAGDMVGVTIRVGKTISGLVAMVADVLEDAAKRKASILLLGAPGMGKTSVIREMACKLAEDEWSVMIVDTSNEIAGDGDIPHPAIGGARRMQVPMASEQHKRMIEAVQNHTPDIIVVDEIGTNEEAKACSTIARRGVMLVATAHGVTLQDVVDNPSLNLVVGGVESVTLGDAAMRERGLSQKTVRECKGPSAFVVAIELRSRTEWVVHHDVRTNVGLMLNNQPVVVEVRRRLEDGRVVAQKLYLDDPSLDALGREAI